MESKKNIRIYFHEDIKGEKFDWFLSEEDFKTFFIDDLWDLKDYLNRMKYGYVSLKYIDKETKKNEFHIWKVDVDDLTEIDLEWLNNENMNRIHFIEMLAMNEQYGS